MNKDTMVKNGKELRCGYTTGSCAAAAATAATDMLLTGVPLTQAIVRLPGGGTATFDIEDAAVTSQDAFCSVTKDGGDDPDMTSGLKICARVTLAPGKDTEIIGGRGVGRVTAKGLQCKVGEPAINPVPRQMIMDSIERVRAKHDFSGGLTVEISVPGGEEIAEKTFNPRLGIIGGISILGTTGIVEPMSEKALVDTIRISVDKRYAENHESILISPGNYGRKYCMDELGLNIDKSVQISNYVGEALDYIKYKGFREILLVGHIGKLVKLAAGVMNTHSAYADCRMEVIGVHCACLGADPGTVEAILRCITTDEALDIIRDKPYYEDVKERLMSKVMEHLNFRLKDQVKIEVLMFSTSREHILKSSGADELIEKFIEEEK